MLSKRVLKRRHGMNRRLYRLRMSHLAGEDGLCFFFERRQIEIERLQMGDIFVVEVAGRLLSGGQLYRATKQAKYYEDIQEVAVECIDGGLPKLNPVELPLHATIEQIEEVLNGERRDELPHRAAQP